MKRVLSILLALLLAAALLPAAALADGPAVVLSTQGLRVNGVPVDCERYNIDGSNYFQLRDLAFVLNGTGSQFSVNWDGANKCVSIVTGELYVPLGTEMQMSDYDKIDTAAPSYDSVVIDGVLRTDLSAWKIGGHNYFKLKDLGEALGFKVDYDTPSRTMIVVTKAWSWPTQWLTVETIYNEDGAALSHSVYTYDEDGRMLTGLWEGADYTEKSTSDYDDLGRQIAGTYDYVGQYNGEATEEHSVTRYEYDKWGLLARVSYEAVGDISNETVYTYDDNGNCVVTEYVSNAGRTAYYYTYDDADNLIKTLYTADGGVLYTEEYTRDADGNVIHYQESDADGEVYCTYDYTYAGGRTATSVYTSGDFVSTTSFSYDERGNQIRCETVNEYGTSVTSSIYDEENRLVQEEYVSGGYSSLTVYTYNEMGLYTGVVFTASDGSHYEETYTYTAAGDPLTEVYTSDGVTRTTTYTYDEETRTQTVLTVSEYKGVG